MFRPFRAVVVGFLVGFLAALSVAFAQDFNGILNSYNELVLQLQNNRNENGSEVRLRLAAAKLYTFAAPLTVSGLESFILEGPSPESENEWPILACDNAVSSALVVNAVVVRLSNLHIQNCTGAAVILQSPANALSDPVSWSFSNVTFYGHLATAQTVARPAAGLGGVAFTASGLLVPELRGSLSLSNCSFQQNSGAGTGVASPPLAVSCPPGGSDCRVSITGSRFAGNGGQLASGALLQALGGPASLSVAGCSFANNTAAHIPALRLVNRSPMPPAALLVLATGTEPGVTRLEVRDTALQDNAGSYGLAAVRAVPAANDTGALALHLEVSNVTLSGHSTGPAAFLAYGVRVANLSDLRVERNLVPPFNLSAAPVPWVCSGAAACIAIDGPQADVALANSTFVGNEVFDSGALFVTTVPRLVRLDPTRWGSLRASDLRLVGTRSVQLGQAAHISAIETVTLVGGGVRGNSGGGGLVVEQASSVELVGVAFDGNTRGKAFDKLGKAAPANADGGGLWLNAVGRARLEGCSFTGNTAARDGGAAVFVSVGQLELVDVTALGNTALGRNGGAFSLSGVNSTVMRRGAARGNAARGGGALAFSMSGDLEILYGTVFDSNAARGSGGAVLLYSTPNSARATNFTGATFTNNTALASADATSMSPGGGGAVHAKAVQVALNFINCTMVGNAAPAAAGGALSAQSSVTLYLAASDLSDNSAGLHGGAVYLSNMDPDKTSQIIESSLRGNLAGVVVSDSGDGSSTSSTSRSGGGSSGGSSSSSSSSMGGLGGAVYIATSKLLVKCSRLSGNTARRGGGAIAARLQAQLEVMGDEDAPTLCPVLLALPGVPRASRRSAPMATASSASTSPSTSPAVSAFSTQVHYATLLSDNVAIAGGALYVADSVLRLQAVTVFSTLSSPGVLLANNSAAVGGALAVYAGREVVVVADFANNSAAAPAAAAASVAAALLRPPPLPSGSDAGDGGTAAMAAAALSVPLPEYAGAGGAIAVRGSETTAMTVQDSAFMGNAAVDGGAVHLASSESCAQPLGCYRATFIGCVLANNTARGGGGGGIFWEHLGLLSVSCPAQPRAAVADASDDGFFSAPPEEEQRLPPPPSAPSLPPAAPPPAPPLPPTSSSAASRSYHRAPPVVPPDSDLLPCDSWTGNAAVDGAYGTDVASTGFTLGAGTHYLDFYTSSSPISVRLSVYDYYGQLCTGGNRTVVIRAVSEQVFGQTYMVSSAGTAAFTDLRLRAQSGWHDVDFAASTLFRDLTGTGITVYVRPCIIGEYLSPTLDQCLACSTGYYNFDHAANTCRPCDSDARCSDADSPGMILPTDGYWQSNFFSEQVLSCPNPDACTYPDRTANLSYIQLQVMNRSREIQASLVQYPNATSRHGGSTTSGRRSLMGQREALRQLLRMAGERVPMRGAGAVESENEGPRDTAALRRRRRQLMAAAPPPPQGAAGGASPYGAPYYDEDYALLLQDVGPWLASYGAAQCAEGYTGVLCGSCATGYGSTGPAQCRRCPGRTVNNAYYALAMMLTAAILAWTIRSLLTQSLFAASQARVERKVEVLGEMRLMGRPLVNPSLVAVLDEDELPDGRPEQPICGRSLPPSLEGLVALRQAYQQRQQELERSISVLDQQLLMQHRQQQQQQAAADGSGSAGDSTYGNGTAAGLMPPMATAAVEPPPPPSRVRGWSTRRLASSVVPVTGVPAAAAVATSPPLDSPAARTPSLGSPLVLTAPPPMCTAAGKDGSCRGGSVESSVAAMSPRAASPYAGIVQTVASSPFAIRPDRAVPTLDSPPGSCGGSGGNSSGDNGGGGDRAASAAAQPEDFSSLGQTTPTLTPGTWPGAPAGGIGLEPKPGVATAPREEDDRLVAANDPWVDRDGPRDSAQERPRYGGSPRPPALGHSGGGSAAAAAAAAAAGLRLDSLRSQESAAAAVVLGVPVLSRALQRPRPATSLASSPAPSGRLRLATSAATATAAAAVDPKDALCGRRGSVSGYPTARMPYGLGGEPWPLVSPRTASATTALRRPWLGGLRSGLGLGGGGGGGGSINGDFPQRQPSTIGGGGASATLVSPRMVSVSGMPSPFLAKVRRRQGRADGTAAGGGRATSRLLLGGFSRLRRSAEDGGGAAAEIEPLRSTSGSTSRSLLNLGAVLRRRLAAPSGFTAAAAAGGAPVSRTGSMDMSRLGTMAGAGVGASGYGGGGASAYGGGTSAAAGGSWWSMPPGGGWRYNEYGVDEFGPDEEVVGTPYLLSPAATLMAPAAIAGPEATGGSACGGGGGGANTLARDSSADANPLQDAATIKIFISYVQILALAKAVPIPDPPDSVMGYLRFYDQLTAIPGSLVSLDCSLPDPTRLGALSKAMQRTLLAALAPLYVSAAVAAVWLGVAAGVYYWGGARHQRSTSRRPGLLAFTRAYLSPRLIMSCTTVMFYFYPNTMRALLSIFSCVSVDSADTDNPLAVAAGLHTGKYWTQDYSEQCYVGRHLALALGLGLSGLLLMGVGWPLGVAAWLYRKGLQQALDFSDFSMVVYASYRELYQLRYLYWESVIMLRQMAVAVVVVLLAQKGVAVQMLVVIALVVAAFAAQLLVQPFRTATMNRLEEVSLVVIMITLYLNLYLLTPGLSFGGRTALAVCIIGINAAMLAVFVYFITRTSWDKQLDHMGLDRRRVYDMDPNEIRVSLSRRYGPRTAALLTRVVTSAQTLKTAKASLAHTGSLVSRTVALASSLKRSDGEAAGAAASGSGSGGGGSGSGGDGSVDGAGRPELKDGGGNERSRKVSQADLGGSGVVVGGGECGEGVEEAERGSRRVGRVRWGRSSWEGVRGGGEGQAAVGSSGQAEGAGLDAGRCAAAGGYSGGGGGGGGDSGSGSGSGTVEQAGGARPSAVVAMQLEGEEEGGGRAPWLEG